MKSYTNLFQKSLTVCFAVSLMVAAMNINATTLIRYKDYLIPVEGVGSCETKPIPSNASVVDSGDARIFVTTDLGGSDHDDQQSMVHLLTFADKFDIEGIATARGPHGVAGSAQAIKDVITGYSKDVSEFRAEFSNDFPDASQLESVVYTGDHGDSVNTAQTFDNSNLAVQAIIRAARCAYHNGDKRPLYLLGWGGQTDIAQALYTASDIRKVVRLVTYSDSNAEQNSTPNAHAKLKDIIAQLWWVDFPTGSSKRPLSSCNSSSAATNARSIWQYKGGDYDTADELEFNEEQGCSNSEYNILSSEPSFFKLGDTITTMFAMNSASNRNTPTNSAWGSYTKHALYNYWTLSDSVFANINNVYSSWKNRASSINQ